MSSLPPPSPRATAAPSSRPDHVGPIGDDPRRWGLPDALTVWFIAFMAVNVAVVLALTAGGYDGTDDFPGWLFFSAQAPFPLGLAALSAVVVGNKGRGIVRDLKLEFRGDDVIGLPVGVLTQLLVVPAVTYPFVWLFDVDTDNISDSANELADRASGAAGTVAFLVAVCVLAPLCEEIFFRGLLFESYKKRRNVVWLARLWPAARRPDVDGRRWNLTIALLFSSAIFSAGHFDLLLFPALMAAGVVFAWMAQRSGRLGPAVWAHFGFNATTALALVVFDSEDALGSLIGLVGLAG